MNKYGSPNSNAIGTTGQMYNENMKTEKYINNKHYGIFSNDNTYAITFNPYINKPPTKLMIDKPVKLPPSNQHITKTYNEPPSSLTDGKQYLHNAKSKKPPLLPPYLTKPEDLGEIQGRANEKDKGNVIYGPTNKVKFETFLY